MFVKKKDGSLRPCVDYRKLNAITKKNRYPLPLIEQIFTQVRDASLFSKIDLRDAYNSLNVHPNDTWKTAFRTKYGLYEYNRVPFGVCNAPSAFQAMMDDIFADHFDKGVAVYLDDILMYTDGDVDKHRALVRTVLGRRQDNILYAKLCKCEFEVESVEFLGHILGKNGISMEASKVKAVKEWPSPSTVTELQSFLGFTNYYRKFINNFSQICIPLTKLLKKETKFNWNEECETSFLKLKREFKNNVTLKHPDPSKPYIVETDASGYAVGGILSQEDEDGELRPVAFYSRKFSPAEENYEVYDQELLAIRQCFAVWRHYLVGANHKVITYSDHRNLKWFMTTRELNRRQARWATFFADYNFEIIHKPGNLCKPDGLSRRPDYKQNHSFTERKALLSKDQFVIRRFTGTTKPMDAIHLKIKTEQSKDTLVTTFRTNASAPECRNITEKDGFIFVNHKLYVPQSCRLEIMKRCHDHPTTGHPGIQNTIEITRKTYYWPCLAKEVEEFVRTCGSCQRNKYTNHKPYGKLQPLPTPEGPWKDIVIDHIPDLPISEGYSTVLVFVCRLTKMTKFIPIKSTSAIDASIALMENVIRHTGIPNNLFSDRGTAFTSECWNEILKAFNITNNNSTAHHHETAGQAEIRVKFLKQYLRHYINYAQNDWIKFLTHAEIAVNRMESATTGCSTAT